LEIAGQPGDQPHRGLKDQFDMWHVLDVGSIWMKEFAAALSNLVAVKCWAPEIRNFGYWEKWERDVELTDPCLQFTVFPMQRGYARFPIGAVLPTASQLTRRLERGTPEPANSTLVCTSPFYAPVAERWPGTVIYYLTDLTAAYPGLNRRQVEALDRRMCRVAALVCPNSCHTGRYLQTVAGCAADKILVIPNATRERNVLPVPLETPGAPPADLADLARPMVAVIGNLAYNLDWLLLRETVNRTPDFSWVFVGPTEMEIPDARMSEARSELMARGGRVRFTGAKPYAVLCQYARACDVAMLPYLRSEATFSCSATRFYEHLAACRPMISTRAVEELLHKEPLLKLVDTATEAVKELERLKNCAFRDGQEKARWKASADGTWEARAATMVGAIEPNCPALQPILATKDWPL
jgi:glycosyltransferase involved in cell wall biosynthesis